MPGLRYHSSPRRRIGNAISVLVLCLALDLPAAHSQQPPGETADLPIRGVVRAQNQATLSTHLRAKVNALNYREGQSFERGAVLVEFDCRVEEAKLAAADALWRERTVALKSASYLQGMKAGSAQEVQTAKAQVDQAAAEIEAIKARIDGCSIRAPFAGVVYKKHLHENELPVEGAPILSIVDVHSPEIELIVSSLSIKDMRAGRRFAFHVDETGETHAAVIRRISPIVDPVSQTMKVYAQFTENTNSVLPGMSGDATFDVNWALR